MNEGAPTAEHSWSEEESALITRLKERGLSPSPEDIAALIAWSEGEEERTMKENPESISRARVELDLKRAKLYLAAELETQARDILSGLSEELSYAGHESDDDLRQEAIALLDTLETPSSDIKK